MSNNYEQVKDSPAHYTVPTPEVTDEDMLGVYEIYRTISQGRTIEPYESLRKEQLEANEKLAS